MTENHLSARQAILVLGMHRSGTSAVSGVLACLGVQPPKTLMQPASDNPSGFWESKEIVAYHERLLASIGSAWSDWSEIDGAPSAPEPVNGQTSQVSALIDQEFGDASLFFVKDPRMCRLTEVWLRALAKKEIEAKAIIPIRHPAEVARSLRARNGFGAGKSYLLWLRHVLDAEHGTRRIPRAFVQYSNLVTSWREEVERIACKLSLQWPVLPVQAGPRVEQFLDVELGHHSERFESDGRGQLDGWVRQGYALLQRLGHDDEDGALRRLDVIRTEFNAAASTFAQVFRETEVINAKAMASLRKQVQAKPHETSSMPAEPVAPMLKKLVEVTTMMREDRDTYLAKVSALACSVRADVQRENEALLTLSSELQAKNHLIEALESRALVQRDEIISLQRRLAQSSGLYRQESVRRSAITAELEKIVSDQKVTINSKERELSEARGAVKRLKREAGESRALQASGRAMFQQEITREKRLTEEIARELDTLRGSRGWKLLGLLRRLTGRSQSKYAPAAIADDATMVKDSGLFDRQWYLDLYPDVARSGMEPVEHYLRFGAAELRNPSSGFDTGEYLDRNPEVRVSGLNPLVHYLSHGMQEDRGCRSVTTNQKQGPGG